MKLQFFKILIATLFIISFASSFVKSISPEDDQAQNEMMASLFTEMGLDKAEHMTRDNLRTILDKLLSKLYNQDFPEHVSFFKSIIEKYTAEVPEKFPRLDIGKYLSQERIMKILQDVVKEQYGEKYAEDLSPAFEEVEKSFREENNTQNEVDEGESPNLKGEGAIDQTPNQDASGAGNQSQNEVDEGESPNLTGEAAIDQSPNQEIDRDL